MELPIVQAPIGSAAGPALVAAVAAAGGLGMLAITWKDASRIRQEVRQVRELTDGAFGVNIVLGWQPEERIEAALAEGVRLFSFFWGDPASHIGRIHDAGALAALTVGSAREASQAVEAGVDVVVAQGWEAGGHVWGSVATLPLVPAVVDAVGPTPVVAAGGIADGRGLAAVLCLGAQAGWLGTRFLASQEALVHPQYKQWVVEALETATVHTELFDGGWPEAPHRVLENEVFRTWEKAGRPVSGSRPGEGRPIAKRGDGSLIQQYSVEMPTPDVTGDLGAMALYAGQSAGMVREILPAAEIIRRIASEALEALAAGSRS
jgi:NAD(P)H-dependent flavin oxidoreductase YrpB (nitropropane dioxygenase family)